MRRTPQIARNINNMRIKPVEGTETAIAGQMSHAFKGRSENAILLANQESQCPTPPTFA
jgi:hypothetical protein